MKRTSPFRRITSCISFLFVFVFAFSTQSCRDDFESKNPPQQTPANKAAGTENKMISYDQFLKQIKGFEDKEVYNHFKSNAETSLRTSEESPLDFRVKPSTTDSVRRISVNNHTTYTIPVHRRSHTGEVFRNIIIDSTDAGAKTYIAWYFPDKNWIKEYKRDRRRSFYGRVIMKDYDLPSDGRSGGRVNLVPVCTSVMVLSEVVEHLCCHNAQHVSCNCANNSKYYFEYLYSTVTTCIDVYIPPFGGTPGGDSGGGGGTIPNPGGGYDPCNGGGLRTSTNPCNPNPPNPGPVVVANANVLPLINVAASKGISFTSTEIAVLNSQSPTMITKIKDLISAFGSSAKTDFENLIKTLTGSALTNSEREALDALADNIEGYKVLMRLMYAANAYAAQAYTGLKYNFSVIVCDNCKANAFKHALFLIFNAETFTKNSAVTLAGAHESGHAGINTKMDEKNNAAGSSIFTQFAGIGTASQWADRVKAATDLGQHGLVFVKNEILVSTKEIDPLCP
ncbi:DUF6973 domain-containing protein [Dyadobacter sp. CY323]|uniref:DUF6973 domain-containing protein n=1 Tax=Dyadobacter sp. CY323 TaxID=2907302 RepID=UPI001F1B129B|nr:hypothetical protein [Dyadobacter sp. CY323]MCE6988993.1 hypothetical protein [Dyadobacter sp. CY323]